MKTALGAFGGILVTLLAVASWQARAADAGVTMSPQVARLTTSQVVPVTDGAAGISPIVIRCAPGEQAIVHPSMVGTQFATTAECVPSSAYGAAMYQPASLDLVQMDRPTLVRARDTVRASSPVRYASRDDRHRRSWAKTALVIGGSTGAGAGIGALAGGKKGALVGAAIGGGAASLFEALKR